MLSQTHKVIQALLFSAAEPLTEEQVRVCLQEDLDLSELVAEINAYYEEQKLPVWIQQVALGYRFMTRREYDPWIRRLYQNRGKLKLSSSALETLAIIAYKKTVTRADIESIRGVNSDATLKTLLEKSLVEVTDRQDGPGRPLIYGTTRYFLEYFGLNSLEDLPDLKELEEIFNSTEQQNFVRENQT